MTEFLAVTSRAPNGLDERRLLAISGVLTAAGWIEAVRNGPVRVWSFGPWPLTTASARQDGVVVGTCFRRRSPGTGPGLRNEAPRALAERLVQERWGAYVAVWPSTPLNPAGVLRDPSGGLEALIWSRDGALFVGSSVSRPGLAPLLPSIRPVRDRIAQFLVDPNQVSGDLALDGLEAVAPGGFWVDGRAESPLWSPAQVARRPAEHASRSEETAALREAVDEVAAGWASLGHPLIGEISGGLDSAIVASAFAPTGRVKRWTTYHAETAEGDERDYARAVARHLDVDLLEHAKGIGPLDEAALAELSGAPRPALNAVDVDYDRAIAEQARETCAWGVVTGQGGDSVFLNLRSALIACGLVERRGWRAIGDPQVAALAAWTRSSVWSVVQSARRTLARPDRWPLWSPVVGAAAELGDLRSSGPRHPWLRDLEGVAPAKRLQIAGLGQALNHSAESRRSRVARLIHLPLQQPVVELCLRLAADRLVFDGRDRALARCAFAERLPESVVTRRSKGDLTSLFGRSLADDLPVIREQLLGGSLRAMGLLDVPVLDAWLDADALLWRGGYGDILNLLAIETWLRDWQTRSTPIPG